MKNYLSLIKFSHTIFALPFALTGFFIGVKQNDQGLNWQLLGLVVLCMVFARSAAMAFNRYLDRDIDAANPRTKTREIPAGIISDKSALGFVILNCILFVVCTFFINKLCFFLSPVALLVILGYSFTKRFTWFCHFVLGLGLALAPVGAYLAVTGEFGWIPVLLGFAVLFWVAGFDIIYALQDQDFDKSQKLYSVPVLLGTKNALRLSEVLHFFTALILILSSNLLHQNYSEFAWLQWFGLLIFIALLTYQHYLVKPHDLSRINLAFFTTNGVASLIFGVLTVLDLLLG
jgi:4-hydroxybenzoate polyprenyltransferase